MKDKLNEYELELSLINGANLTFNLIHITSYVLSINKNIHRLIPVTSTQSSSAASTFKSSKLSLYALITTSACRFTNPDKASLPPLLVKTLP